MASMALEAIASGTLPAIDPAVGFLDTGATLITDKPVDGVESIDTAEGLEPCWG
jgi:fructose transport system substrate-binding protein